jgi:hypothetical protein
MLFFREENRLGWQTYHVIIHTLPDDILCHPMDMEHRVKIFSAGHHPGSVVIFHGGNDCLLHKIMKRKRAKFMISAFMELPSDMPRV